MDVSFMRDKDSKSQELEVRFLDLPESWIFQPDSVVFYEGYDLGRTTPLEKPVITKEKRSLGGYIVHYKIKLPYKYNNLIRIKAFNREVCPKGHPGEGKPAWIFCDEIIVR